MESVGAAFVLHMVPQRNVVDTRGAPTKPKMAELASHMTRRLHVAATRGARDIPERVDFASGMVKKLLPLPGEK